MATLKRKGFGQVEPNHLSAQRTGQIYAQLIADSSLSIIENGMFLKYDYENRKAVASANVAGEWLLVYNEEKLYDPRKQSHKHFAMQKDDYVDKEMVPRLFKTNVGDIFVVGSTGYLEVAGQSPSGPQFKVVALTTMPDGQDAVKVQRIA